MCGDTSGRMIRGCCRHGLPRAQDANVLQFVERFCTTKSCPTYNPDSSDNEKQWEKNTQRIKYSILV